MPIPNLVESALELFKAEILKEFLVICKKNNFGENSERKEEKSYSKGFYTHKGYSGNHVQNFYTSTGFHGDRLLNKEI